MKLGVCSLVVGGSVLVLLGAWRNGAARHAPRSAEASVTSAKAAHPRAAENYGKLPMSFEVNEGQTDGRVAFLARGQGYTLFLNPQEAVLALQKAEVGGQRDEEWKGRSELIANRFGLFKDGSTMATSPRSKDRGYSVQERGERPNAARVMSTMLEMKVVGANAKARVVGAEELPGKSNYFIGNDPKRWRTNIATYAKVRVEDIYPGVDLVYYGNRGELEYDFVVRPGANPSVIKLGLTGASLTKVDAEGDLVVQADGGEVRFHKPVIYQPAMQSGRPVPEKTFIAGGYRINETKEVEFAVSDYDRTKPLVIDPVPAYSTYLGGSGENQNAINPTGDEGSAIAADTSGNAYVTGFTTSPDFPVTPLAFQLINHDTVGFHSNAFVSKISADGTSLIYSTYLGGSGTNTPGIATGDQGYGIAVDASGEAYVSGVTASPDFPVTPNAFQAANNNSHGTNGFVTKLDNSGSSLLYSTYLGGSSSDGASGIVADRSGNAYVTGSALSSDFPVTPGAFQAANHGGLSISNAFVTKINAAGSALVYSTYLGGTGRSFHGDFATGIAVDASGNAYVTGAAASSDFPTANPFQATNHSAFTNAFVTKINPDGSGLVYSTYLGGSGGTGFNAGDGDGGTAIAVDGSGSAYVTGQTSSTDFPSSLGAFQAAKSAGTDAFVTKLSADGSALVYSTYLGSSGNDDGTGIAIFGTGFAYVTGSTSGIDFPTSNPIQATNHGRNDTFMAELTQDGSALVFSTYLGGSLNDSGSGVAVDVSGDAYVTGYSFSTDFPTANPLQPTNHNQYGQQNAFVVKISAGAADVDIANNAPDVALSGSTLTYSITVTNNGPDAASNVNIQDAIPAGTNFNSVATTSGLCTAPAPGGTGTVNCIAPALATGSAITETLTVNVTAGLLSTITDTATVSSTTFDPTSNTSATATTTVVGLPSIGGLTGSIGFGKGGRTFY